MLPITLRTDKVNLSNEEFFYLCAQNKDLRFERDKHKNIIIMSPVGFISSNAEAIIIRLLEEWNNKMGSGYVTSSSGGFILSNGATRCPDAAWTKRERIEKLSEKELQRFPHLCPDFIIEVRSPSDSLKSQKDKMQEWIDNGCLLAWLIDLAEQKLYIYRKDSGADVIESFNKKVSGEEVLPGFELDLTNLK